LLLSSGLCLNRDSIPLWERVRNYFEILTIDANSFRLRVPHLFEPVAKVIELLGLLGNRRRFVIHDGFILADFGSAVLPGGHKPL
jgi:hypothetical protein